MKITFYSVAARNVFKSNWTKLAKFCEIKTVTQMRKDVFPAVTTVLRGVKSITWKWSPKNGHSTKKAKTRTLRAHDFHSVDGALRRETRQMQLQLCARLTWAIEWVFNNFVKVNRISRRAHITIKREHSLLLAHSASVTPLTLAAKANAQ